MDKIVIKNLNIFAYHGVFEEEKKNGQLFRISAELRLSLRKAAQQDDLRSGEKACFLIRRCGDPLIPKGCDVVGGD